MVKRVIKKKEERVIVNVDSETGEIIGEIINDGYMENSVNEAIEKVVDIMEEKGVFAEKTYRFSLNQLIMKNKRWEMHIMISGTLNRIHKSYKLTLVVNLDDISEKIDLSRSRMDKAQLRMDGGDDEQDRYHELLNTKDELINNCPDIQLEGSVLQSKYPVGDTFIVFHISPEVINKLNDRRNYMEHYNIKMEPYTISE